MGACYQAGESRAGMDPSFLFCLLRSHFDMFESPLRFAQDLAKWRTQCQCKRSPQLRLAKMSIDDVVAMLELRGLESARQICYN
jgi:hypothetical protein